MPQINSWQTGFPEHGNLPIKGTDYGLKIVMDSPTPARKVDFSISFLTPVGGGMKAVTLL